MEWTVSSYEMLCLIDIQQINSDKYKHINTCGWMDEYGYRQITVRAQSFGNDET